MDWGSLAGLLLGLTVIIFGQWIEGGELGSLLQPVALVIVLGGTLGAVLLQNGLENLLRGVRLLRNAFMPQADFYLDVMETVIIWSTTARMEGFRDLGVRAPRQKPPKGLVVGAGRFSRRSCSWPEGTLERCRWWRLRCRPR